MSLSLRQWKLFFAILSFVVHGFADPCGLAAKPFKMVTEPSDLVSVGTLSYSLKEMMRETSGVRPPENPVQVPILIKAKEPDSKTLEGLFNPKYETANDAGLLLMFRAPSSFSLRDCGQKQISASSSVANSMVHARALVKNDGTARFQVVDALGETNEIKYEDGDCQSSITVGLRTYRLMGGAGGNPLGYLVSDHTIEQFHKMKGDNDPYLRNKLGHDQFHVSLADNKGDAFQGEEGKYLLLPLRIKYDEYIKLAESESSKTTLNVGGQVLVPLQRPFGQAGVGVHANLSRTDKISSNWLSTVGAGIGMNIQSNVLGGYNPSDRKVDPSLNGTIAAGLTRVDSESKGSTSFVVAVQGQSALLNRENYRNTNDGPFLQRQSAAAALDSEKGVVVAIIRQSGDSTHSFQCKEDFKGKGWKSNGNNNEDFRCSYSYSRRF